jgi:hypothetical protein
MGQRSNVSITENQAPSCARASGRHSRTIEQGLLILNLALFVFCVADWVGWLPFGRGFQPLQMVYLSGALLLQPLGSLIQRRSIPAYFALLVASIALLVMSATLRR